MPSINTLLRANPRNCAYGAPMGASGHINEDQPMHGLRCERMQWVDGDYGPDGTYWGYGQPIYIVFNGANDEYKPACGLLKYYRANSRAHAIAQFLDDYPDYSFSRGSK